MRAELAFVTLLLLTATAAADDLDLARHDIVDARHMREPQRVHVLGWAADGAAYVRRTACSIADGSGHFNCRVSILRFAADGTRSEQVLLDLAHQECDPTSCANVITTPVASAFLAAEKAYRATLPPLAAGTEVTGKDVFGSDASVRVVADARADLSLRLSLVAQRGGKRVTLATRQDEGSLESSSLRAWRSPDGSKAIVAARYETRAMCWGPFKDLDVHHVDIAAARAKL